MKKIIAVYAMQSYTDPTGTVYPAGALYQLNSYPSDTAYAKELAAWAALPLATVELDTMPSLATSQWDGTTKTFIAKVPALSGSEQTIATLRAKSSSLWTVADVADWLKASR